METPQPLVSIIVTSYNYGQYIDQTIRSVLAQTYENWELIISDDDSSDNSLEVIRSFPDPRITIITSEKNQGAWAAYTKAYAQCKGEYLSSLDSDDYIASDKLEKQVRYLTEHPEVGILGTFVVEVDAIGQHVNDEGQHEIWFNKGLDLNQPDNWLWQNRLCHSSVLMRKSSHERVGQFNKDLIYAPDYEFWVRCLISGGRFHVLPEKLTYYRAHDGNVTHKNPSRAFLEHVYIFCVHLKPYLFRLHRSDLVHKSISSFLMHNKAYREASPELKTNILRNLLSIETQTQDFKAFLKSIQNPLGAELLITTEVFNIALMALQESARAYCELEKGKAWSDEQNHNCMETIRKQTDQIKELQTWIMELEKGKDWLEQNWQAIAQQQDVQIKEMQAWITELEKSKDYWQYLAEDREVQLCRIDEIVTRFRLKSLLRLILKGI